MLLYFRAQLGPIKAVFLGLGFGVRFGVLIDALLKGDEVFLMVFVIAVTILLPIGALLALRNTPQGHFSDTGKQSLIQALSGLKKNKPLFRLLTGVLLIWLGGSVFNAMIIFIEQHTLKLQNQAMLWFVFTQYAVGLLCLPLGLKLANRIGRHRFLVLGAAGFMLLFKTRLIN